MTKWSHSMSISRFLLMFCSEWTLQPAAWRSESPYLLGSCSAMSFMYRAEWNELVLRTSKFLDGYRDTALRNESVRRTLHSLPSSLS